jgi:hypothetical protein
MRPLRFIAPVLALFAFAGAAQAATPPPGPTPTTTTTTPAPATGGAGIGGSATAPSAPAHPTVSGTTAKIIHGLAYAPSLAPIQVQRIIWAGDKIRHKPYIYGGGHGIWNDAGYDCSGSVSYVLHAAGLLKTSMDSTEFESWDMAGIGQWVTVYTNPAHAFIEVAGIRLDTSAEGDPHPAPGTGPRWRPLLGDTQGFQPRHPTAF